MKKLSMYVRVTAATALFVLLLTTSAFASPQMNEVSPDEAANLALFYTIV